MSDFAARRKPEGRRYRKVFTRMHADDKYRQLSRPQPNGQSLWMNLIAGPWTTALPGLLHVGELALAESLDWPIEGFRAAWAEIAKLGMAEADWKARVIWLPKAIAHNEPESPNVVRSWRTLWDEVPDCSLKANAFLALRAYLGWMGTPYQRAFLEACPKPSSKPTKEPKPQGLGEGLHDGSLHGTPNQEQDQEQEQSTPLDPPCGEPSTRLSRRLQPFWSTFQEHYPAQRRQGGDRTERAFAAAFKGIKADGLDAHFEKLLAAVEQHKRSMQWQKDDGAMIPNEQTWLSQQRWNQRLPEGERRSVERDPAWVAADKAIRARSPWCDIRRILQTAINRDTYHRFFADAVQEDFIEGPTERKLVLSFPTSPVAEWVRTNYNEQILTAMESVLGTEVAVTFTCTSQVEV